jgi:hypothetical protein
MSTPETQSAQPDSTPVQPDADATEVVGQQTTQDDVTDNLPLPNDPVDATGLLSADDLNGEVTD